MEQCTTLLLGFGAAADLPMGLEAGLRTRQVLKDANTAPPAQFALARRRVVPSQVPTHPTFSPRARASARTRRGLAMYEEHHLVCSQPVGVVVHHAEATFREGVLHTKPGGYLGFGTRRARPRKPQRVSANAPSIARLFSLACSSGRISSVVVMFISIRLVLMTIYYTNPRKSLWRRAMSNGV